MSARLIQSVVAMTCMLVMPAGGPAVAQEPKKPARGTKAKPASQTPSGRPATKPAEPAPQRPAPNPGNKPVSPAKPKPGPAKPPPSPSNPPLDNKRAAAVMRAIETRDKSELAGAVFKKFLDAKSGEERVTLVVEPDKHEAAIKQYFSSSPNREFTPVAVHILGSVNSPSAPDRLIFPYFVATDKNKLGFIVAVIETAEGFKVDWPTFSGGHDQSLEGFLNARKPGDPKRFLLGVAKTHIFGDAPDGGEAKWAAYAIEMPLPRDDEDPAKIFVEKGSELGRNLASKLGWAKGHLCYLTLDFEGGSAPFLKATGYEPYAK